MQSATKKKPMSPQFDGVTPGNSVEDSARNVFSVRQAAQQYYKDDYYGRPRFRKYLKYFSKDGPILDLGCNDGVFLNLLRSEGFTGIGVDRDAAGLSKCRAYGLTVIEEDICQFITNPKNHGCFSGVMLADFVEHFDPQFLQTLLTNCVRMLQPDGTLLIITPNSRCLPMILGGFHENEIEHHNLYSTNAISRFLSRHGTQEISRGVDVDSRLPIGSRNPLALFRNLFMAGFSRMLVGKNSFYEHAYLVMRKSSRSAK